MEPLVLYFSTYLRHQYPVFNFVALKCQFVLGLVEPKNFQECISVFFTFTGLWRKYMYSYLCTCNPNSKNSQNRLPIRDVIKFLDESRNSQHL